tara:strand:- start:228 stop:578 length:351 start_codon:yes stop_codon:yes gene_type:complete
LKNLKLIINNSYSDLKEDTYFFNKKELKIILNLYARMVSLGFWKDYNFNISKKSVDFSIFKRTSENPIFKICKNFKPSNKNFTYYISDVRGNILSTSGSLEILIEKIKWNKYKIVS